MFEFLTPVATAGVGAATQQAPGYAVSGDISDRSVIHIAPVAVNLGAILLPFNEGSPENGGYGFELASRLVGGTRDLKTLVSDTGGLASSLPLLVIVGLGIYLLYKVI